jgi:hypothetical protein
LVEKERLLAVIKFSAGPARIIVKSRNRMRQQTSMAAPLRLRATRESGISHNADHAMVARPDAISILA